MMWEELNPFLSWSLIVQQVKSINDPFFVSPVLFFREEESFYFRTKDKKVQRKNMRRDQKRAFFGVKAE